MTTNTNVSLAAALERLLEACELPHQRHYDAQVRPDNPAGQSTATLPDGTKVDRHEHLKKSIAEARKALRPFKADRLGLPWTWDTDDGEHYVSSRYGSIAKAHNEYVARAIVEAVNACFGDEP